MGNAEHDGLAPASNSLAPLAWLAWLPHPESLPTQPAGYWTRLGLWHDRVVQQQLPNAQLLATQFERHGLSLVQALWAWCALPASNLALPGLSAVLAQHFSQQGEASWAQTVLLILDLMQNRRYDAVAAAGRLLLPPACLAAVHAAQLTPRGERLAVALLLYASDPERLTLLTLYERAERFGYARHLAAGAYPAPPPAPALDAATVNTVLASFEGSARGGGRSLCLAVLAGPDAAQIVFIRRILREAAIQELDRTLFGDEAELIVLKFTRGLQVLEEHSVRGIGLAIGEALAAHLLQRPVCYLSDATVTPAATIHAFLDQVQNAAPKAPLHLIELHLRLAPFDGSPSLTLRGQADRPLRPALEELAQQNIHLLNDLFAIRSITLAYCPPDNGTTPHLFKVTFTSTTDGFVLHYAGVQSALALRRQFETHLKAAYAVAVIPTVI